MFVQKIYFYGILNFYILSVKTKLQQNIKLIMSIFSDSIFDLTNVGNTII